MDPSRAPRAKEVTLQELKQLHFDSSLSAEEAEKCMQDETLDSCIARLQRSMLSCLSSNPSAAHMSVHHSLTAGISQSCKSGVLPGYEVTPPTFIVTFDYPSFMELCASSDSSASRSTLPNYYQPMPPPPQRPSPQIDPNAAPSKNVFHEFLRLRPTHALPCLGVAAALFRQHFLSPRQLPTAHAQPSLPAPAPFVLAKYCVRFKNHPVMPMKAIGAEVDGHFVCLKGQVLKSSIPRLMATACTFLCPKCGASILQTFQDGIVQPPPRCLTSRCGSKNFDVSRSSGMYVSFQRLTLQEHQDGAGQVPTSITVEVREDLVELCKAGESATISGVVRSMNSEHFAGRGGKRSATNSLFVLFLEANHVQGKDKEGQADGSASNMFGAEQLAHICRVSEADPGPSCTSLERNAFPFDLLVRSFCPEIFGHELTKAGLVLVMLGGTPADLLGYDSQSGVTTRSNPHLLIVGDPGMGKSQLLRRAHDLSPRAVYIGGNTSSTAGLTVAVVRDGSDTTLEAGALVLADQGVCCIDEFDKMTCDENALLECMEQQEISVAKSGICTTLPARCSIIAMANPKQGHYNADKSVSENLNMKTPLLSRFDLCFILKDDHNVAFDDRLSAHVMNQHRHEAKSDFALSSLRRSASVASTPTGSGVENYSDLIKRLKKVSDTQPPLPLNVMKDYISYAREFCKPKLTKKAALILQNFYIKLRGNRERGTIPITTRQLESMIRLSQARAKACLREWVTAEDAEDVVQLMMLSVVHVNSDAEGNIDVTRGGVGGSSKMGEKKTLVKELRRIRDQLQYKEFTYKDVESAAYKVLKLDTNLKDILEELRNMGEILRVKNSEGFVVYKLAD